jgi:LuxR family transcriptional regulator, quorum-sensing system regulator SdiA
MHTQLDIPDLLLALMEQAPAGFAIGLHIRYQTPALMFQTYPLDWLSEYSRDGLMMRDPTVVWGLANVGIKSWEALSDQDPAGVFERARRHGMAHGFAVSLDRGGSRSLGGFARGDRDFTPEEIETIQALMSALHGATASATPLAPETRETLRRLSVAFTQP